MPHVAAKRPGLREHGERLDEHKDCRVRLELSTDQHRLRGKTVLERLEGCSYDRWLRASAQHSQAKGRLKPPAW
jgi:hypothetical protein